MMKKYNWQNPKWPHFEYDLKNCHSTLYEYAKNASQYPSPLLNLSKEDLENLTIEMMVTEALSTSEIEGEKPKAEDIRSSLLMNLGLIKTCEKISDKIADSIALMMLDVRCDYQKPLSKQMLQQWHQKLMSHSSLKPEYIGVFRYEHDPMQVVSGPMGREVVHFEAPPSHQMDQEMDEFIKWFNATDPHLNQVLEDKIQGPIRAAIAHLYFESIHPFMDGNGRIGRAIVEKALSQDMGYPILFSVSKVIYKQRKMYYENLKKYTQYSLDLSGWIEYFTQLVYQAQIESKELFSFLLKKKYFLENFEKQMNERQLKVIQRMFHEGLKGFDGGMSAKKYMNITQCSKATATRDLADLLKKGCLYQLAGGGTSTRYDIHFDAIKSHL